MKMAITKNIPLALSAIAVNGSDDIHLVDTRTLSSASASCSSQQQRRRLPLLPSQKNATLISEPTKYFPEQIKRIVDAADAISPDAINLPEDNPYPVIDISPWLNPSTSTEEDKQNVINQVLTEATSAGSFNIVGHGIGEDVFDNLYASSQRFFSMSLEEKMQFSSAEETTLKGYVAQGIESSGISSDNPKEKLDLKELFTMSYPPNNDNNVKGPEEFHDAMSQYMEQLQSAEVALQKIFTAALSMAKEIDLSTNHLRDVEEDARGMLRAFRYPHMPGFEDATKLKPHSDLGTITIIASDTEEGLEEIRDGRWYRVPMGNGELHVAVGEVLSMWSNGLFRNNIHRVSKEAKKDRLSFPYFVSQGKQSNGPGISPICSSEEMPIFPRVSPKTHVMKYFEQYKI